MKINNEIITSKSNNLIKMLSSLKDKKGREENKLFMAEGVKLTLEAIEAGLPVKYLIVSKSNYNNVLDRLNSLGKLFYNSDAIVQSVSDDIFSKISTEKAPQGVISIIKHLDFFKYMNIIYKEDFFLGEAERAIFLCSVRDPANLGSVIRSSVAFGVDHIVLSEDCADIYNPKSVRSAMGSLFRVKVTTVGNIESFIEAANANNRRVFAAELSDNARPLDKINIKKTDLIMIGNEGHGIPKEISEKTNGSVYIPISKKTESLNASVAAGIFIWEQSKI